MTLMQALALFSVMVALAALPSSSVMLVVARSVTHGLGNGIAVAVGIVIGDLAFVLLAILGLSAVAEALGGFFVIVRLLGGLYLIWLGVSMLRGGYVTLSMSDAPQKKAGFLVSVAAGFFLTLGDVKAILFYASLFPLFIDLSAATTFDYSLVAGITIVSVGSVKSVYAVLATRVAAYADKHELSRAPQKLAGGLLVGAGSYLAIKA